MIFDSNAISKLFDSDAKKASQLFRTFAKQTTQHTANAVHLNNNFTTQIFSVAAGKIRVLYFPTITPPMPPPSLFMSLDRIRAMRLTILR
jgi:hypothetical protein